MNAYIHTPSGGIVILCCKSVVLFDSAQRGRGNTYCKPTHTHIYTPTHTDTHKHTHPNDYAFYTYILCVHTNTHIPSPPFTQHTHRGRADTYRKLVKPLKTPAGTLVSWFEDRARSLWA